MTGAFFYYQFHWWRNRFLLRVRRLRQPKYLFGAMVGGLYFYWYFFRTFAGMGRGRHSPFPHLGNGEMQTAGSLILLVVFTLAWVVPHGRAALAFTEAEVAFLFPAPVSRRSLIHFKLLKSETVTLFSAIFLTLIGRSWGTGPWPARLLGWFLIFSAINLNSLGTSFAITRLIDRGLSTALRRAAILVVALLAAAGIFAWLYLTAPPLPGLENGPSVALFKNYAHLVVRSGPLPYLLFPFRLLVAPYFASSLWQFLIALGPALAVIGLLYFWVIRSDVAFEEASVELARKNATRQAGARAGQWQAARPPKKGSRAPFVLRPAGYPAAALFWKNLISAGALFTTRFWLFLVWAVIISGAIFQSSARHSGGWGAALSFMVLSLLGISLFAGPQLLRNDLRQDLTAADILKMFPIPGWQTVLGEVLAPVAILSALQWLLLGLGTFFFPAEFDRAVISIYLRISVALALALVLPCIDLIIILIPNAAALYFPAWFQLGKDAPRGFETSGQRLILMFGQVLITALSLVLPALFFIGSFMVQSYFFTMPMAILLASVAAAAALLIEAGFIIKLLGGVFERFDLSGEALN